MSLPSNLTRVPERLAIGVLDGKSAAILTVPRQTRYILSSAAFTNLTNATIQLSIYAIVAGTRYPLTPTATQLEGGAQLLIESPMSLEPNEVLYLECNKTKAVSFYISGIRAAALPSASNRAQ
jgi:hypothetical protein